MAEYKIVKDETFLEIVGRGVEEGTDPADMATAMGMTPLQFNNKCKGINKTWEKAGSTERLPMIATPNGGKRGKPARNGAALLGLYKQIRLQTKEQTVKV